MENNLKNLDFTPTKEEVSLLNKKAASVVSLLKKNMKSDKISAQVFIGGSFAKETIVKKDKYDIDIFIRIDKKNFQKDIALLEKTVSRTTKALGGTMSTLHGSRDYYQIALSDSNAIIEIIPVLKIKKPEEAENVTDLSYFHVDYIKKKVKKKEQREVRLAKTFLDACNCYGAESYIQGFSGYAVECLIANYKTLKKMLVELTKEGKIIVDSAKHYKNPKEALIALNEAKTQSPIVIIDPTWKKRNALASLSQETYERFKKSAISFLKNPTLKHFERKEIRKEDLKESARKLGQEFVEVELETNRQEGDIAGTKLKKGARYVVKEGNKAFVISKEHFIYDFQQSAILFIIAKPIKEIFVEGPPIKMIEHVRAFKAEHKNTFVKKGKICTIIKNNSSLANYLKDKVLGGKELRSMGITRARII